MMRRSIFALLFIFFLLAASASACSSTDLLPAASTLPPILIASHTPTAMPPSIHVGLREQCGSRGVNNDVHYAIRFTSYEGPDIMLVDRTFEHNQETQRILLESGPVFEHAVTFLTDGHNGWVEIKVQTETGGCESRQSELGFFLKNLPEDRDRVDFAGYDVHTIELRLDEVLIESPGSDPSDDGIWTDVAIHGELILYGNLPTIPTHTPTRTPTMATPEPTIDPDSFTPTASPAPTPTAGPPFPGADQWVLRLHGMRPIHLTGTSDGGHLLLASANSPNSYGKVLMRLDAKGRILWQNDLGQVDIFGVVPVADGGAVGLTYDGLVKFSPEGEFEWQGVITNQDGVGLHPAFRTPNSILAGSGGKRVVLDFSNTVLAADGSFVERTTLDSADTPDGFRDMTLTLDARWYAGVIEYKGFWVKRSGPTNSWVRRFDFTHFGSDVHSEGVQILPTSDGGALFVGLAPYLRGDLARSITIWAARLDRYGNLLWHTAIDGGVDRAPVVIQTADGGFLIATSSGYMIDEMWPLRMLRLDAAGNVFWDRFYRPTEGSLIPHTIVEGGDRSITVAAHAVQGWSDDSPGDLVLIKTDRYGRVVDCPCMEQPPFDPPILRSPETVLDQVPNVQFYIPELSFKQLENPYIESQASSYALEPICAFPPLPAPPTPTPLPTPIPTAAEPGRLYPFGTSNGVLLGASRDGEWLQPYDAARGVTTPMPFHLYGLGGYRGEYIGSQRDDGLMTSCPGSPWIDFTTPPPSPDLIALSGTWDVQPRRAWEIVVSDTYITVVEDFLRQAGMPGTPVKIDKIYRFDIEGDGFEEVLIAASHFENGLRSLSAAAGDYSILILRALVDGQVTSVPLIDQHYPSARPGIHPAHFRIGGILDLNGDGAYDLIAIGEDAFSTHYWTFDLTQPALGPVAQMSCRP